MKKKKSILLVDDEYGEVFQKLLELEDYFVMLYKNGQEAIEEIEGALKYSLGVIDLSLPIIDGTEVINTSKRINPQVPIIALSGYNIYKPANSDRFIGKPVSTDKLIKIIDSFFRDRNVT